MTGFHNDGEVSLCCRVVRDLLFLCVILWHQIKALIKKYIQRQQTINLVVVPCNVDIATTEALSMAHEVDPDGDRTIGKKGGSGFREMGREGRLSHMWKALDHLSGFSPSEGGGNYAVLLIPQHLHQCAY